MINIIPTPKRVERASGLAKLSIEVSCEAHAFAETAAVLSDALARLAGEGDTRGAGAIRLICDPSVSLRGYRLDSREEVILAAADVEGIAYATATLIQMIEMSEDGLSIPRLLIEDRPDCEYRTLMVDLARRFHTAEEVMRYAELCHLLKIRYLHLHFCDNERYTLPSAAFPRLSTDDHYTREEIEEIRLYARARGVVILPELEVPGHARILTRAYPEVFGNRAECRVEDELSESGVAIEAESLICAGSADCFAAIETLLDEVCAFFPDSPYIHIGGDEANIGAWAHCTDCRAYMAAHGLRDTRELYSEFVGRTARAVLSRGRIPVVWEGFPQEGTHFVPPETLVVAWESLYQTAPELLDAGFSIINGSWKPYYIVPHPTRRWSGEEILGRNIYRWENWWSRSRAYEKPIDVEPTDRVIGAQISVWECTFAEGFDRAVENLAALSERMWTVDTSLAPDAFRARLDHLRTLLRCLAST